MNKLLLIALALLASVSCQRDKEEIQPQYDDWYALKAPIANANINAVYGDIDGTVAVATLFNVFYTSDRGRTWHESQYDVPIEFGISGIGVAGDTLILLSGENRSDSAIYTDNPRRYSVDNGASWQRFKTLYRKREKLTLNVLTSLSGITYRIKEMRAPAKTGSSTSYYLETEGISSSDGQLLKLPERQQTKSIYLDNKQRLYVAGSAPYCGTNEFEFCGDSNGRVYISKQPVL